MAHLRLAKHYINGAILLAALAEGLLLLLMPAVGSLLRFGSLPPFTALLLPSLVFAVVMVTAMLSMGVYESLLQEGFTRMMLRTAVAIFLLGAMAIAVLSYLVPGLAIGRGILLLSSLAAFVVLGAWRWLTGRVLGEGTLKRRVVVLGTGQRAQKIAARMRRRVDQRSFELVGFIDLFPESKSNEVALFGGTILPTELSLLEFCRQHGVDEVVVAMDQRRRNQRGGGIPLDELLECRLQGIDVCDVQQFIEREAGKIDVDLLQPSWLVFSDGFDGSGWRFAIKRGFDVSASLLMVLVLWPIMLVTALLVWLESRGRDPVLYVQERVGLNGRVFRLMKFRSMRPDAEQDGRAVWAVEDDPRVTRVGAFIRRTRLDELPQLFNVLRGDMGFVGPRPERPAFVAELSAKIPYYAQRHSIKPGITGWAQLCYPYGASVEDAKEKLQYDLYYLKNHSILLDLIILSQTVEVVLVGDGAR